MMKKRKIYVLFLFLLIFEISCSTSKEKDEIFLFLKAYKDYVDGVSQYPDLKNIPQYIMLLPEEADELAIEIVPFLNRILASKRIKKKNFTINIAKLLSNHKISLFIDSEIKKINPYFEGDINEIIKKTNEYLRRGLPTLRDDKVGNINLFNYVEFSKALMAMRNAFQNQDFATLFFFHPEKDRDRFEKLHDNLKKNILTLVKIAKNLNISGLKLYRMEFLKFYELLMQNIFKLIESFPSPNLNKIIDNHLFFLFRDISQGNDLLIYPDYKKIFLQKENQINSLNTLIAIFNGDRKLKFTKEGNYWRMPELPILFWDLLEKNSSIE